MRQKAELEAKMIEAKQCEYSDALYNVQALCEAFGLIVEILKGEKKKDV